MWRQYVIKSVKYTIYALLLVCVGIIGFFFLSDDYNAYIVLSDSMKPTFSNGDLVLVGSPGHLFVNKIAPGNIITYRRNEALITHRVVSITEDTLITKGDAMEDADPWQVSLNSDVEGGYIACIPYLGHLNMFIKTKTGWFLAIFLPTVFLLALLIKEIVKEALRDEKIKKEVT
jgi:signal peptidase